MLRARSGSEVGEKPDDGAYIDGLHLEGCRWDARARQLSEAWPRELHARLPVLWLRPSVEPPPAAGVYEAPVYLTGARHGKLSTTGHSSNFVLDAQLPTDQPQAHWVRRGVALVCALDD